MKLLDCHNRSDIACLEPIQSFLQKALNQRVKLTFVKLLYNLKVNYLFQNFY